MQELMGSEDGLEFIVDHSTPADNRDDAAYDISTMIMAPEGGTISGDLIADAAKEAKESQRTLASVIREKLKDSEANITTIVSPGDGVPEPQQREGGSKKKSNR